MTTPDAGEKWGILGGTFDPVHNGHISLAIDCAKSKKLDGVLCIPSFLHPFKKDVIAASFDDRLEMLKVVTSNEPLLSISTIEKDEHLSGFTIDTIIAVKKRFPKTTFYFIIGADNLSQLDKWHKPDEIIREVNIISGNRPHFSLEINEKYQHAVEFVDSSYVDIASTEIRQMIQEGEFDKLKAFMNPDVLAYIKARNLYQ